MRSITTSLFGQNEPGKQLFVPVNLRFVKKILKILFIICFWNVNEWFWNSNIDISKPFSVIAYMCLNVERKLGFLIFCLLKFSF